MPPGPSLLYIINWNCLQTETKFEIQDESTEIEGTELEFDLKAPVKKTNFKVAPRKLGASLDRFLYKKNICL